LALQAQPYSERSIGERCNPLEAQLTIERSTKKSLLDR
jgi:hypothetical protein